MSLDAPTTIQADLDRLIPLLESRLSVRLLDGEAPSVGEAMRYSLNVGGKRVRPVLCMLASEAVGGLAADALPCAIALEYIHTYSLIHDDLPAMDDDDLRRGKPTCHKVFGEGQAILAGDGLLTEAFHILATEGPLDPTRRIETVRILAEAAGWKGMVGGQSLDLAGEILTRDHQPYGLDHLKLIHRLKTGALIRASLELGGVTGGASTRQMDALREAGAALGLAFQIQDDILDATSTAEVLGKRAGKDADKGKITYPLILGIPGARQALQDVTQRATSALETLPNPEPLVAWARFLAERIA